MLINFRKMFPPQVMYLPFVLLIGSAGWSVNPLAGKSNLSDPAATPKLVNTCLITDKVEQLTAFYELVLGLQAKRTGKTYAEISTGGGVLAIFSSEAQEKYIPGSAEAAKNKSMILEFRVSNLDHEYNRLQGQVKTWVKLPSKTPWGTRSMYFRDPDGNLVDFYELPQPQN